MVKRAGGESLAVNVYEQLRYDILDRRFVPGERLMPVDLCRRFGVSISVMREALGLLVAQNLVNIERNRGFRVMSLSIDALKDLTAVRKINEGTALRLAVERGGVAWESELLAAHHRMAGVSMNEPGRPNVRNRVWATAHIAFHYTLIEACGNTILLDICARLSDAAELYRAWAGDGGEFQRDVAAEHKALLDAALAHDADLAVSLFEAHVDLTAEIVLNLDGLSSDRQELEASV